MDVPVTHDNSGHNRSGHPASALFRLTYAVILVSVLSACGGAPRVPDSQPEPTPSYDGLLPTDSREFSAAWLLPGTDLERYREVLPGDVDFEFRANDAPREDAATANAPEFWISAENRQALVDTVAEAIVVELDGLENWQRVAEPGPAALILDARLLGIVAALPPEQLGANDIYLGEVGEATLVLELRDSLSGQTLYRAVDRRPMVRDNARSNAVTTWAELRRWARRWAVRLTDGLAAVRDSEE